MKKSSKIKPIVVNTAKSDKIVNTERNENNKENEESIIKITYLLIKVIHKKINYKILFFLLLAIFIGYYFNNQNTLIIEINKIFEKENLVVKESIVDVERKIETNEDIIINNDINLQTDLDGSKKNDVLQDVEIKIIEKNNDQNSITINISNKSIESGDDNLEPQLILIANETTEKKVEEKKTVIIKEININDIKLQEKTENEVKKNLKKEEPKKQNDILEKEAKNFKQVKISQIKPKKMWIPIPGSNGGHRRVPALEVKAGKEHKSSVKMWLYEEFLSKEECENLIKVHEEHVKDLTNRKPIICFDSIKTVRKYLIELGKENIAAIVTPNDFIEGTKCINQTLSRKLEKWGLKWSYSTAFYPGESKFSKVFARRIEEATQLNETHGGKFQITSYPTGVGYKSHTDCTIDGNDERDRYATFLVYLNDFIGDEGGETNFTLLGIDVKPKKGRALTWNNMNYETGKCEDASAHEANKVNTDTKKKYIIQRWYYYKNFYSLGKRMPEPEIPARESYTPRVSCDEYDHGSCRLYDEWNYDHLLEYSNRKHTFN